MGVNRNTVSTGVCRCPPSKSSWCACPLSHHRRGRLRTDSSGYLRQGGLLSEDPERDESNVKLELLH